MSHGTVKVSFQLRQEPEAIVSKASEAGHAEAWISELPRARAAVEKNAEECAVEWRPLAVVSVRTGKA